MTACTRVFARTCVACMLECAQLIVHPIAAAETPDHSARPPAVARHTPAVDATGVQPATAITVTFTRRIDPATLSAASFRLSGPDGPVAAAITWDERKRLATLAPAAPLRRISIYTVQLTADVRDRRGRALVPVSWSFESSPDPSLAHAAFPFSEGSGSTSADSSANGNRAQLTGDTRWSTSGKFGGALVLEGGSDGAAVPAGDSLNVTNGLTIEAWIHPAAVAGHPMVLMREAAGEEGAYSLGLAGNKGGLSARIRTTNGLFAATVANAAVPPNAWTHVAATYDGTQLRVYRNGIEVGSTRASGSIVRSTKPLWLGRGAKGDALSGVLDEVRVYNRALQAAELAADMAIPADDVTPPTITSTLPASAAPAFDPRLPIVAHVSMPLAPASITSSTVVVRDSVNAAVPVSAIYRMQDNSIAITPTVMLAERSTYTVTVTTGVANNAGVALQNPYSWSFTTADVTPPAVVSISPASSAVDVDPATSVTAIFGEDVATATVNTSTFVLRDQGGAVVPASVAYVVSARAATLLPSSTLMKGRSYTATIAGGGGGIADLAGNRQVRDYTWSFTTHQDQPPEISGIAPASGTPGTTVVLSGARFGSEQGSSVVRFNGLIAPVTTWSDTSIVVAAPPFVTTGDVTVTVGPQVSNGALFTYTGSGPNVTVTYQPHANAAGWYRVPVQAFFQCIDAGAGVQSCPPPITIASEGAAQTVAVTASDLSGHYTAVYATADIDFTPPIVTITAPQPAAVLTAATITVTARVSDLVSGVQSASCNGVAATLSGDSASCDVALGAGRNPIVVRAIDRAGNERSAGVVVSRTGMATALIVTPSHHTLAVGETRVLTVTDDIGRVVGDATWSTSNPLVAAVDASGGITAVTPGDADITATLGSLSGSASVSVQAGAIPNGTALWSDDATTPDWSQDQSIAVDSSSAAFVTTEVQFNSRFQVTSTHVRGFDDDGHQTALVTAPLGAGEQAFHLMGDWAGGVLLLIDGVNSRSIVRVPVSPDDSVTWRAGGLTGYSGNTAQGPDGTIFTLVGAYVSAGNVPTFADQAIVGIDGDTGAQRFSVHPIKPSYGCDPFFGGPDYLASRFADGVTVDTEGYANVLGVVLDVNPQWATPPSPTCQKGTRNDFYPAARIVLYRIAPDGTTNVVELYRHVSLGTLTFRGPFYTLPDDQGGVLAAWNACDWSTTPADCRVFARHVDIGNALGPAYELPNDVSAGMISASGRTAYMGSVYTTPASKFDMRTGAVLWSSGVSSQPTAARADGRVEMLGPNGVTIVDPTGAAPPSALVAPPLIPTAGSTRITSWYGDIRSVVAESFLPDQFGFAITEFGGPPNGGGLQGRNAAPGPYGVFFKGHNITYVDATIAWHASIRIVPRDADQWRARRPDVFFSNTTDTTGHIFATIGAGPGENHARSSDSTVFCSIYGPPYLTDAFNFSQDISIPASALERLRYSEKEENDLTGRIIDTAVSYRDDLHYCFNPYFQPVYYNSNSFIHGLLNAVDIPEPTAPRPVTSLYVGWDKAVPTTEFLVAAPAGR